MNLCIDPLYSLCFGLGSVLRDTGVEVVGVTVAPCFCLITIEYFVPPELAVAKCGNGTGTV